VDYMGLLYTTPFVSPSSGRHFSSPLSYPARMAEFVVATKSICADTIFSIRGFNARRTSRVESSRGGGDLPSPDVSTKSSFSPP
jgi:hypothetical protein